jgi:dTDP-4-dehydrorhamnose reductase
MSNCIIGYTGFIGKNLIKQKKFFYKFNTKNIGYIYKYKFKLCVICAPHAKKWWANKNPKKDTIITDRLLEKLKTIQTQKIVFISTVDVFNQKLNINENSKILTSKSNIYGKNRLKIEKFIQVNFKDYYIIRLPALYGKFLKKNILFDLMHNNELYKVNLNSQYQWYFIGNLMADINKIIKFKIRKINLVPEPIKTLEIVNLFFKKKIPYLNSKKLGPIYNIKTIYGKIFNSKEGYIINKKNNLKKLKSFIKNETIDF